MDSIPPTVLGPILTTAGWQLQGTKIEYIWKRRFSVVTFLFFMNRYYAFGVFITTLLMLVLPNFNPGECTRSAFFVPFMSGIPMTLFPDVVIGIRSVFSSGTHNVYALYGRNRALGVFLATYLIAELGVALWLYTTPSLHTVALPGPPEVNSVPVLHAMGARENRGLKFLMVKDGIIYYAVAFFCNLTWALMVVFAPRNLISGYDKWWFSKTGLKYAASEATVQVVCMSVNRLTLSLRSFQSPDAVTTSQNEKPELSTFRYEPRRRRGSWIGTSTFEIGSDHVPRTLDFGAPLEPESLPNDSQATLDRE
ncbi:hypothetical protein SCHPADRAFT_894680 [Schizopora paradoxa]|uniref:Transmembrane protein n=1 Tax=Schizopora paradoxa TaxID=27342 RepID=A0A0H2RRG9_9AGAM|nr:hypothetical protein SCHPADRAFT_894680 [Schizopora paradoxa]